MGRLALLGTLQLVGVRRGVLDERFDPACATGASATQAGQAPGTVVLLGLLRRCGHLALLGRGGGLHARRTIELELAELDLDRRELLLGVGQPVALGHEAGGVGPVVVAGAAEVARASWGMPNQSALSML